MNETVDKINDYWSRAGEWVRTHPKLTLIIAVVVVVVLVAALAG